MSHSQFRNILLILRHAWLNLQVKHMLLAGSTRLLFFDPDRSPAHIISLSNLLADLSYSHTPSRPRPAHSVANRLPNDASPPLQSAEEKACQYYLQSTRNYH